MYLPKDHSVGGRGNDGGLTTNLIRVEGIEVAKNGQIQDIFWSSSQTGLVMAWMWGTTKKWSPLFVCYMYPINPDPQNSSDFLNFLINLSLWSYQAKWALHNKSLKLCRMVLQTHGFRSQMNSQHVKTFDLGLPFTFKGNMTVLNSCHLNPHFKLIILPLNSLRKYRVWVKLPSKADQPQ